VPIDFALYMPKSWTDDDARREKARVPDDLVFKTKPDLALDLITRAVEDKIPGDIVLTDAAYGGSSEFRNTVRIFGLDRDRNGEPVTARSRSGLM
jgi:SRSO17 transposase